MTRGNFGQHATARTKRWRAWTRRSSRRRARGAVAAKCPATAAVRAATGAASAQPLAAHLGAAPSPPLSWKSALPAPRRQTTRAAHCLVSRWNAPASKRARAAPAAGGIAAFFQPLVATAGLPQAGGRGGGGRGGGGGGGNCFKCGEPGHWSRDCPGGGGRSRGGGRGGGGY